MQKKSDRNLTDIADYYSVKLSRFGETPKGVDWNGVESQTLRFQQLCRIINRSDHFTINDLGCGYGALLDFLSDRYDSFTYRGFDISKAMVLTAKNRHIGKKGARFEVSSNPDKAAEYSIASGIFNVKLKTSTETWQRYIIETLECLNETSSIGFAFNCLTRYSDADKMKDYLYYADPCKLFDLCKQRFSKNVALLHDYGLYEFTILVKKKL